MTHTDVNHTTATHYLLTGQPPPHGGDLRADWPHVGRRARAAGAGARSAAAVCFAAAQARKRRPPVCRAEPRPDRPAGWASRSIRCRSTPIPAAADYRVGDFRLPTGHFGRTAGRTAGAAGRRQPPTSADRQQDAARGAMDRHVERAFDILHSATAGGSVRPRRGARRGARALRAEPARAVGVAGPAAGRTGRAAGDRLLAQRRHQERQRLLGHAQPQLHRSARAADAAGRPGVLGLARRSGRARTARRDARHLDRRVRPHAAGRPAQQRRRRRPRRPRSLARLLHQRAGRRRHSGRTGVRRVRSLRGLPGVGSRGSGRPGGDGLSFAGRRRSTWPCPTPWAARWWFAPARRFANYFELSRHGRARCQQAVLGFRRARRMEAPSRATPERPLIRQNEEGSGTTTVSKVMV